ATMLWASAAGLVLLLVSAWMLNPLCVKLMPIAALLVLIYPLCKRFTWTTHFVLGAVDGLAPLGAYIGIAGKITLPALLLFAAVTIWVAGFDIIYALMDLGVDRAQGIRSLPVRFGEASGRVLPIVLHAAMLLLLGAAGVLADAGRTYFLGVLSVAVLIIYEEYLFRSGANLFVINERIFISNMTFSVFFLITTVGGYV
ncbi:MAG: UbiA family prenyltransferase, partial [Candidatus Cybelea sp.]